MRPPPRAPGFTLLELLAALAVLAVLASLSFRGLSSVLDAEAHVREDARRWNDVGLLLAQLREDVGSAVSARGLALGGAEAQLVLTRFAEVPGVPPRRVGYRLREGAVEYLVWPSQPAAGAASVAHPVLTGIAELRFTALREDGTWTPVWPPGPQPPPRALAVELLLARGERITRLFPLR
jgi:general secretion pathway protein J